LSSLAGGAVGGRSLRLLQRLTGGTQAQIRAFVRSITLLSAVCREAPAQQLAEKARQSRAASSSRSRNHINSRLTSAFRPRYYKRSAGPQRHPRRAEHHFSIRYGLETAQHHFSRFPNVTPLHTPELQGFLAFFKALQAKNVTL
jgi:hypothetical protein